MIPSTMTTNFTIRGCTVIRPLLDGDDLERYRTDGYVALGPILDDDQCAALVEVEQRYRPDAGSEASDPGLLVREQLCAHSAALRHFCIAGAHVPLLAQVLGPDVAFTHTQFITKLPDRGAVDDDPSLPTWIPMHQDDGYGQLAPPLDVTVWTALTDTDEENGCLVIVPGSHRGGLVDHAPAATNPFLREAEAEAGDAAVPLPLRAGEAVLFTGLTLHGSGPNRSRTPRVGMHARYCHPSVRMVTHRDKPVLADRHSWMVLGEAELADPRVSR